MQQRTLDGGPWRPRLPTDALDVQVRPSCRTVAHTTATAWLPESAPTFTRGARQRVSASLIGLAGAELVAAVHNNPKLVRML